MVKVIKKILAVAFVLAFFSLKGMAQGGTYDVFVPISKYITQGDAEKLSAWFSDNLEVSIKSSASNSSKNQACQIMKNFFEDNTPRSFEITHTTGEGNMKYAIGMLKAGGESFQITIFVNSDGSTYKIQQLKIDRMP